jgi:hypothetical protein
LRIKLNKLKNISGSKSLILLSFFAAGNPFWIIFALPCFLIGAIGILTSKRRPVEKLLWTILPLLLWFPFMLLFMKVGTAIKKANAQKIQFEIPENFRGVVTICFPASFGQKVEIDEGREVIHVPESGIVFYSGEIQDGYMDWQYSVDGKTIHKNESFHVAFSPGSGGSVQFGGQNSRMRYCFRELYVTDGTEDIQGDSLEKLHEKRDSIVEKCFLAGKDLINQ